jgi:hypothetical protein
MMHLADSVMLLRLKASADHVVTGTDLVCVRFRADLLRICQGLYQETRMSDTMSGTCSGASEVSSYTCVQCRRD